jgi:TusE/DsrC/DsvC family sulfur relay protein
MIKSCFRYLFKKRPCVSGHNDGEPPIGLNPKTGREKMMEYIQGLKRPIPLDSKGFIRNFQDWDEQFTRYYAANKNLSLGEEQWDIIRYLRRYFAQKGAAPLFTIFERDLGISQKKICELFNLADIKDLCKLAGLPCND